MSNNSMIKWRKSDYMRLSWAVRNFNKIRNDLINKENKLYLPELKNYSDIKSKIFTRTEFNRIIKNLNNFSLENNQRIIELENNEKITNWEYKELKKEKRRAERRLTSELIEEKERNVGLRAGFRTAREKELEANIKSLNKLYSAKGFDFKQIKNRLHSIGFGDYDLYRNEIYRKNFYKALKGIKHFKNYNILKDKLDSIRNPKEFFDYIQKSEILSDLFLYYSEGDGLVYGSFASNEDAFDYSLEQLGLLNS